MANIKSVVDIFETTAEAMVGLDSFTYGNRSDINTERDKGYPRLLIDRNAIIESWDSKKNQKTVRFIFQFYGLFHRDVEALDNDQDLQNDLDLLAYQYLREVERRFNIAPIKTRLVDSTVINGEYAFMAAQDRLIRLQLSVRVLIIGDCSEGQFNY